jgi:hypothetical protein
VGWFASFAVLSGVSMAALRASGYRVSREVRERLSCLAPWQYVVMEAIGGRVLDPERASVGLFADEYIAKLPKADRDDLFGLLAYIEHIAPYGRGMSQRFSALSPSQQDRVLTHLEQSEIGLLRGGFQALKALCLMAYYRKDESFRALGYGGPAVKWGPG